MCVCVYGRVACKGIRYGPSGVLGCLLVGPVPQPIQCTVYVNDCVNNETMKMKVHVHVSTLMLVCWCVVTCVLVCWHLCVGDVVLGSYL